MQNANAFFEGNHGRYYVSALSNILFRSNYSIDIKMGFQFTETVILYMKIIDCRTFLHGGLLIKLKIYALIMKIHIDRSM